MPRIIRILAFIIATIFTIESAVFASPDYLVSALNSLPENKGAVRAASPSSGNSENPLKHIVIIEDAHESLSAQQNIGAIVQHILSVSDDKRVLIGVEGASEPMNFKIYDKFPLMKVRMKAADKLMALGFFTGVETALLNAEDNSFYFAGCEEPKEFEKNIQLFKQVYSQRDIVLKVREKTEKALAMKMDEINSVKLQEMFMLETEIRSNFSDFAKWAAKLFSLLDEHDLSLESIPNLILLREIILLSSSLSEDALASEYKLLFGRNTKPTENELLKAYSKITDFSLFPLVGKKVRLIRLQAMLDLSSLSNEIYTSLYDIQLLNVSSEAEKRLVRTRHFISHFFDALLLQAPAESVSHFIDNSSFIEESLKPVLTERELLQIRNTVPLARSFYEYAVKRDILLVDNLIRYAQQTGNESAVLIAGGYHTNGIRRYLSKMDIGYSIVMPSISVRDKSAGYFNRMLGASSLQGIETFACRYLNVLGRALYSDLDNADEVFSEVFGFHWQKELFEGEGLVAIAKSLNGFIADSAVRDKVDALYSLSRNLADSVSDVKYNNPAELEELLRIQLEKDQAIKRQYEYVLDLFKNKAVSVEVLADEQDDEDDTLAVEDSVGEDDVSLPEDTKTKGTKRKKTLPGTKILSAFLVPFLAFVFISLSAVVPSATQAAELFMKGKHYIAKVEKGDTLSEIAEAATNPVMNSASFLNWKALYRNNETVLKGRPHRNLNVAGEEIVIIRPGDEIEISSDIVDKVAFGEATDKLSDNAPTIKQKTKVLSDEDVFEKSSTDDDSSIDVDRMLSGAFSGGEIDISKVQAFVDKNSSLGSSQEIMNCLLVVADITNPVKARFDASERFVYLLSQIGEFDQTLRAFEPFYNAVRSEKNIQSFQNAFPEYLASLKSDTVSSEALLRSLLEKYEVPEGKVDFEKYKRQIDRTVLGKKSEKVMTSIEGLVQEKRFFEAGRLLGTLKKFKQNAGLESDTGNIESKIRSAEFDYVNGLKKRVQTSLDQKDLDSVTAIKTEIDEADFMYADKDKMLDSVQVAIDHLSSVSRVSVHVDEDDQSNRVKRDRESLFEQSRDIITALAQSSIVEQLKSINDSINTSNKVLFDTQVKQYNESVSLLKKNNPWVHTQLSKEKVLASVDQVVAKGQKYFKSDEYVAIKKCIELKNRAKDMFSSLSYPTNMSSLQSEKIKEFNIEVSALPQNQQKEIHAAFQSHLDLFMANSVFPVVASQIHEDISNEDFSSAGEVLTTVINDFPAITKMSYVYDQLKSLAKACSANDEMARPEFLSSIREISLSYHNQPAVKSLLDVWEHVLSGNEDTGIVKRGFRDYLLFAGLVIGGILGVIFGLLRYRKFGALPGIKKWRRERRIVNNANAVVQAFINNGDETEAKKMVERYKKQYPEYDFEVIEDYFKDDTPSEEEIEDDVTEIDDSANEDLAEEDIVETDESEEEDHLLTAEAEDSQETDVDSFVKREADISQLDQDEVAAEIDSIDGGLSGNVARLNQMLEKATFHKTSSVQGEKGKSDRADLPMMEEMEGDKEKLLNDNLTAVSRLMNSPYSNGHHLPASVAVQKEKVQQFLDLMNEYMRQIKEDELPWPEIDDFTASLNNYITEVGTNDYAVRHIVALANELYFSLQHEKQKELIIERFDALVLGLKFRDAEALIEELGKAFKSELEDDFRDKLKLAEFDHLKGIFREVEGLESNGDVQGAQRLLGEARSRIVTKEYRNNVEKRLSEISREAVKGVLAKKETSSLESVYQLISAASVVSDLNHLEDIKERSAKLSNNIKHLKKVGHPIEEELLNKEEELALELKEAEKRIAAMNLINDIAQRETKDLIEVLPDIVRSQLGDEAISEVEEFPIPGFDGRKNIAVHISASDDAFSKNVPIVLTAHMDAMLGNKADVLHKYSVVYTDTRNGKSDKWTFENGALDDRIAISAFLDALKALENEAHGPVVLLFTDLEENLQNYGMTAFCNDAPAWFDNAGMIISVDGPVREYVFDDTANVALEGTKGPAFDFIKKASSDLGIRLTQSYLYARSNASVMDLYFNDRVKAGLNPPVVSLRAPYMYGHTNDEYVDYSEFYEPAVNLLSHVIKKASAIQKALSGSFGREFYGVRETSLDEIVEMINTSIEAGDLPAALILFSDLLMLNKHRAEVEDIRFVLLNKISQSLDALSDEDQVRWFEALFYLSKSGEVELICEISDVIREVLIPSNQLNANLFNDLRKILQSSAVQKLMFISERMNDCTELDAYAYVRDIFFIEDAVLGVNVIDFESRALLNQVLSTLKEKFFKEYDYKTEPGSGILLIERHLLEKYKDSGNYYLEEMRYRFFEDEVNSCSEECESIAQFDSLVQRATDANQIYAKYKTSFNEMMVYLKARKTVLEREKKVLEKQAEIEKKRREESRAKLLTEVKAFSDKVTSVDQFDTFIADVVGLMTIYEEDVIFGDKVSEIRRNVFYRLKNNNLLTYDPEKASDLSNAEIGAPVDDSLLNDSDIADLVGDVPVIEIPEINEDNDLAPSLLDADIDPGKDITDEEIEEIIGGGFVIEMPEVGVDEKTDDDSFNEDGLLTEAQIQSGDHMTDEELDALFDNALFSKDASEIKDTGDEDAFDVIDDTDVEYTFSEIFDDEVSSSQDDRESEQSSTEKLMENIKSESSTEESKRDLSEKRDKSNEDHIDRILKESRNIAESKMLSRYALKLLSVGGLMVTGILLIYFLLFAPVSNVLSTKQRKALVSEATPIVRYQKDERISNMYKKEDKHFGLSVNFAREGDGIFKDNDLVLLTEGTGGSIPYSMMKGRYLKRSVYDGFTAMYHAFDDHRRKDGKSSKYNLSLTSAFRSVDKQATLFNEQKLNTGNGPISVAPVGTSEHHVAAIDIYNLYKFHTSTKENRELKEIADYTFAWLSEHAHEFGFVQSYPENNAKGVVTEQWHYRYDPASLEKKASKFADDYLADKDMAIDEYVGMYKKASFRMRFRARSAYMFYSWPLLGSWSKSFIDKNPELTAACSFVNTRINRYHLVNVYQYLLRNHRNVFASKIVKQHLFRTIDWSIESNHTHLFFLGSGFKRNFDALLADIVLEESAEYKMFKRNAFIEKVRLLGYGPELDYHIFLQKYAGFVKSWENNGQRGGGYSREALRDRVIFSKPSLELLSLFGDGLKMRAYNGLKPESIWLFNYASADIILESMENVDEENRGKLLDLISDFADDVEDGLYSENSAAEKAFRALLSKGKYQKYFKRPLPQYQAKQSGMLSITAFLSIISGLFKRKKKNGDIQKDPDSIKEMEDSTVAELQSFPVQPPASVYGLSVWSDDTLVDKEITEKVAVFIDLFRRVHAGIFYDFVKKGNIAVTSRKDRDVMCLDNGNTLLIPLYCLDSLDTENESVSLMDKVAKVLWLESTLCNDVLNEVGPAFFKSLRDSLLFSTFLPREVKSFEQDPYSEKSLYLLKNLYWNWRYLQQNKRGTFRDLYLTQVRAYQKILRQDRTLDVIDNDLEYIIDFACQNDVTGQVFHHLINQVLNVCADYFDKPLYEVFKDEVDRTLKEQGVRRSSDHFGHLKEKTELKVYIEDNFSQNNRGSVISCTQLAEGPFFNVSVVYQKSMADIIISAEDSDYSGPDFKPVLVLSEEVGKFETQLALLPPFLKYFAEFLTKDSVVSQDIVNSGWGVLSGVNIQFAKTLTDKVKDAISEMCLNEVVLRAA